MPGPMNPDPGPGCAVAGASNTLTPKAAEAISVIPNLAAMALSPYGVRARPGPIE